MRSFFLNFHLPGSGFKPLVFHSPFMRQLPPYWISGKQFQWIKVPWDPPLCPVRTRPFAPLGPAPLQESPNKGEPGPVTWVMLGPRVVRVLVQGTELNFVDGLPGASLSAWPVSGISSGPEVVSTPHTECTSSQVSVSLGSPH